MNTFAFRSGSLRLLAVSATVALASGCASTVSHTPSAPGLPSSQGIDARAGRIEFSLTPEAKVMQADNPVFRTDLLQAKLESTLRERKLLVDGHIHVLDVQITQLRARSGGAAFWAGAFAGSDLVSGIVTLRGPNGAALKQFKVDTSYSFGGLAGVGDYRMNWMYEKFSSDTADGLASAAK